VSKLRFNITISLDGYVSGPNQSVENPLGEGAFHIHDWALPTKTFRSLHGDISGGETGINDDVLREGFENIGATIMGRNMFGPVRGPWGKDHGRDGGAMTLHSVTRFSCSHITRASHCPCGEARHSFSSPTASSRLSSRQARQPMARTWHLVAEPKFSSTIPRDRPHR
jgi:hypothetical protein